MAPKSLSSKARQNRIRQRSSRRRVTYTRRRFQTSRSKRSARRRTGPGFSAMRPQGIRNDYSFLQTKRNGVITLEGTDLIGPITVKSADNLVDASDWIVYNAPISPSGFPGTRLNAISQLWERYRFRKFDLFFVPALANTLSCQLIMYEDTDPIDDPTVISNPDALWQQAMSQGGASQFNFTTPKCARLCQRKDDEFYYTGDTGNQRFINQGRIFVLQSSFLTDMNGQKLTEDLLAGTLYIKWRIDLQTPQINPESVVRSLPTPPASTIVETKSTLNFTLAQDTSLQVAIVASNGPFYLTNAAAQFNPTNTANTSTLTVSGIPSSGWNISTAPTFLKFNGQPILVQAGTYHITYIGAAGVIADYILMAIHSSNVSVVITPTPKKRRKPLSHLNAPKDNEMSNVIPNSDIDISNLVEEFDPNQPLPVDLRAEEGKSLDRYLERFTTDYVVPSTDTPAGKLEELISRQLDELISRIRTFEFSDSSDSETEDDD